ncbi:hypothetical protein A9G29_00075 [Gilliamella sp. Fer2-1]|nr:hypothetical protein A9G29_00075 [Gilliamella apicola]
MHREDKPKGFFYLDHRTVDGKHNLITDTYVTAGNIHDPQPYMARLKRQLERFGFNPLVSVLMRVILRLPFAIYCWQSRYIRCWVIVAPPMVRIPSEKSSLSITVKTILILAQTGKH